MLTGQASKSIAEQQKAVADAHAKNAQIEAAAAKNIAEQATGDARIAYQHAANAAGHAATARTYSKEALGYAADAAIAASKASQSLARTIEYDRQATEDAKAADKAAGRAEGHAKEARDSADQAALDAAAAREAAATADQAAKDARTAADRAAIAATEAEQAAKDALKYAQEAQKAVEEATRNAASKQVSTGAGTGIGGTWYVVDEDSIEITDTKQHNPCEIKVGFEGCTVTFTVTFSATVDFFLCTNPDVPASANGCPGEDTLLVKSQRFPGMQKDVTEYCTKLQLIEMTLAYQVIKAVLVQDFIDCWHGSASGCAWALSNFIPGKAFEKVVEGIRALDAAMKTGVGVRDAFTALKNLDNIDPATLAKLEKTVNASEDFAKTCPRKARAATKAALSTESAGICWADLTGPGEWKAENESMKASALAYQVRITGVPAGMVYRLTADTKSGWVKFDGFKNGTLLDAKHGYLGLIDPKTGRFYRWYKSAAEEAQRQNKAFERHGIPLVWHCSEADAVPAFKAMLKDERITSITVVYTP